MKTKVGDGWKNVGFSLYREDISRIETLAKEMKTSQSDVVRRAVVIMERLQKKQQEKLAAQAEQEKVSAIAGQVKRIIAEQVSEQTNG